MRSITIIFLFFNTLLLSQNSETNWIIKKDSVNYYVSEKKIVVYSYEVINISNDVLWFWLMENNSFDDKQQEIKNYFFSRKGDFSLFDIAMEVNIKFEPSIFYSFITRIKPKEKFIIYFISEECTKEDNNKFNDQVISKFRLFPEKQLFHYDKKFELMIESNVLFYKNKFIIIPQKGFIRPNQ